MPDVDPAAPAPEPPANATTPAKPPLTEADVKAAADAAYRKAQAEFEKKRVEALRQANLSAQQREAQVRQSAKERLTKLGDRNPDDWESEIELRRDAAEMRALRAQAQQYEDWDRHVKTVAEAHGLEASDARLAGASSAGELAQLAKAAMVEDAVKEKARVLAEAEAAAKAALQARVDAGELDTLEPGAAPPAGLQEQYNKEMLAARGKGFAAGRAIREKYRAKGLAV